jgi:hypothetical protein
MSKRSAYNLRERGEGGAFRAAWNAALEIARESQADEAMARAMSGCVEVIVRDGIVWGERHYLDNRHAMAVLNRLDRQHERLSDELVDAHIVASDFDAFLDIVCAGDDDAAADFIAARRPGPRPPVGETRDFE